MASSGKGTATVQRRTVVIAAGQHIGWPFVRQQLRRHGGFRVVNAGSPEAAVHRARREQPDLILLDGDLAVEAIDELARQILLESPNSRIVLFGERVDRDLIVALDALGIGNVLPWDAVSEEKLLPALLAALAGNQITSQTVIHTALAPIENETCLPLPPLTERQRDVLAGLILGRRQKEIASHLGYSLRSIHREVRVLKSQFDVASVGEVIEVALDRGFELGQEPAGD